MAAVEQLVTGHLELWTAAIKRKSAAGRGSSSKIELYGIKKLRELILELAVRGLLVPQDPSDEPASELLKKIAAEKVKLVKEGRLRKEKSLPLVCTEEKPFALPGGWLWERFGSLAEHNAGKTLDQGRNQGELRDYITTSNLYWGKFDLLGVRQMPIEDADLEKCLAVQNDLLICEGGEAGRAAVWNHDYPICFQNHIHRARFWQGINPYYAYRLLEKMSYSGEIDNFRKGVAISNMSGKALGSIPFPLPPLAEQHRIVAKVDDLMALCDQLEQQTDASLSAHQTLVKTLLNVLTSAIDHAQFASAWQHIAEHFDTLFITDESIDQLKQTILQLAVMGKLVPQDPNDEPASELLKKVAAEKAKLVKEGKIKKTMPLPSIAKEDERFDLPEGWRWTKFDQIAKNERNALKAGPFGSALKKSMYTPSGYKIYGQEQVISGDENIGDYFIDEEKYKSLESCSIQPRDILISLVGTIGKVLILTDSARKGIINPRLVKLSLFNLICREYIKILLGSKLIQDELYLKSHGSTMDVLNLGLLKALVFPLPPAEEQQRIVAKVDELMVLCDQIKSRLKDAQTTQLHLADTLTERALARA